MERAIAAAERRAYLLPECRSSQLELALLYYFAGHYEDALEEVSMLEVISFCHLLVSSPSVTCL
jgi:hypothetical protein